jgi:hypothetical protein
MMKGYLPYRPRIAEALRGIPWRRLNESLKSYRLVEEHVMRIVESRGVSAEEVKKMVDDVLRRLSRLRLRRLDHPPLPGYMGSSRG